MCLRLLIVGHESYGREVYQPNRILVLVREHLDDNFIQPPFSSLLTENVIDVSTACQENIYV